MGDFTISELIGFCCGLLIGIFIIVGLQVFTEPKAKISGSYLTYENVVYKQVPQEELDNIIILEVK